MKFNCTAMFGARAGLPSSPFKNHKNKTNKQTIKQTNHKYKNEKGPTDLSVR